ncbi:MAG: MFS transporter [Planctomycetes bacterium]|nr:MFS transporter [Planctomycetota bacterium]MCB9936186.1 MFS transporter [Planctomycetota bacterium]
MSKHPELSVSERAVVLLIAAVHFINILDFMIVMPLGPEFARELGISTNHIGLIAGSYTAAAAVSGVAGSFFLDRFDRRKALAVSMFGLVLGTALAGLSWNLPTLIAARVVAGLFGGPATAISLAIIADVVPRERRGRAMGTVMSAFSIASIAGVPISLEIAHAAGWRAPFYSVAALGAAVSAAAIFLLPPLKLHLSQGVTPPGWGMFRMLGKPLPLLSALALASMVTSAFAVIPNIPVYLEFNLHYTGEAWIPELLARVGIEYTPSVLGPLYLIGGTVSLLVIQFVGRLTDRFGSAAVSWVGALLTITVMYIWFINYQPLPSLLLFVFFMGAMTVRGVPARTLDTKVPMAHERAAFMSMQSAVQHTVLALAASLSSFILTENPDKSLQGMPALGLIAVVFAILLPTFITLAELGVRRRDARQPESHALKPPTAAGMGATAPVPARAPAAPD